MALVLADRVRESTLTTGTGTVTLVGPVTGYQTFAAIGDGNTTYYTISNPNGTEWEVGIGTYTAASKTLSRDTVLSSSNGGAKTSFSVGSKDVFVSYPAEKSINQDEVGNTFVPNLGATTPSSGVFTTLTGNSTSQFGRSSANYFQAVGAAANLSPEISVQGSDASIPFTIESKGTGAVNLVPGSRGVNVSNGQTVTALTRTAVGQSYTSVPTMTISAPTTAGGVQATATVASMGINFVTIASGGTGYAVNDEVLIVGGSFTTQARYRITGVSGGVVTTVLAIASPVYQSLPTNPASTTAVIGTGSGLTLTVDWAVTAYTITNAGSGYVEQPTVTFSGGGGSGAAAIAVVGSIPVIRSINDGLFLSAAASSSQPILRLGSVGNPANSLFIYNNATGNDPVLRAIGTDTNVGTIISSQGTGSVKFFTNAANQEQFRVAHTASAVNYVQVTGAATTAQPVISAQGSDTNISFRLRSKGSGFISLENGAGASQLLVSSGGTANYLTAAGSNAGAASILGVAGTDTNISMALQSKGTGAINLAPGSSGVNVSNGNTVTAITRTAGGSGYTSIPTVAISAPTTTGGVQATATVAMEPLTITIASGGTGYTLNDVLTFVGGTVGSQSTQVTVTGVSGGVITSVSQTRFGRYTVLPTNPISVTGGTGTGATFNVTAYAIPNEFTITNAGSGYVEQPTVSFSGGGGSGAAAYATVGSGTTVRSLGSVVDFTMPGGVSFRVGDAGATSAQYWQAIGGAFTGILRSTGATQNGQIQTGGTGSIQFTTNNGAQEQCRIAHTASAVNYVQVTGAPTANIPQISAQGSDTNISLAYTTKGFSAAHRFQLGNSEALRIEQFGSTGVVNRFSMFANVSGSPPLLTTRGSDTNVGFDFSTQGTSGYRFYTNTASNGTGVVQFQVAHTASTVNNLQVTGSIAGSAPVLSAQGSDTNIDLALTPKGTGLVRFGTYVAGALTATGSINIKAADGTTYKVLVST